MRKRFINRSAKKCVSANGNDVTRFSMPQAKRFFSIFVGGVCIAAGLSQTLAHEVVTDFILQGQQNVEMREA